MTEIATVKPHLERLFNEQRVVCWRDPEGQYTSELDSLDTPEVTTRAYIVTESKRFFV